MLAALILLKAPFSYGQEPASVREGKLKAACLYYLAKFIGFPSEYIRDSTIRICVVGEDIANTYLEPTFAGKNIAGSSISLLFYPAGDLADTGSCNIIYMGDLKDDQQQTILTQTKLKPVLTISGAGDLTGIGGIVQVKKEDNKIRIKINPKTALESGLKVSSELLHIAEIAIAEN